MTDEEMTTIRVSTTVRARLNKAKARFGGIEQAEQTHTSTLHAALECLEAWMDQEERKVRR